MTASASSLPPHYRKALRTLLRFAIAMTFAGLLLGLAFQESARKLSFTTTPPGVHLESILPLALVHGHAITMGVLLPLGLAGALLMARRCDQSALGRKSLLWLTRGYLPFATASVMLMLYKGYHVLLSVRAGSQEFAGIDAALFGGSHLLRYGLYGLAHTGMGVTLGVFLVALWRSLGPAAAGETAPAGN